MKTPFRSRSVAVLAAVGLAAAFAPAPAHAQYFGQNKVQYRDFDFKVLKTANFDIYYYPEEQAAVEEAGRLAERWYARFSRVLNHRFAKRQPLVLYASHPHFEQTNVLQGFIGEGTGGVTEVLKRRVVLPMAGPLAETDHVLGHELVHAFQFDMTGRGGATSSTNIPNAVRLPLWFIEGMAEYLSVGPVDPHTAMWMRDAARREKLPTIRQLSDPKYFPYRYGQALWSYIAGRWGDEVVADALRAAARQSDPERILESVTGLDHKELSKQWHTAVRDAYRPVFEAKREPAAFGRLVLDEKNAGDLNVAPALSPDGKQVIFFSEKDVFSINLYLADADTGQVRRKLIETSSDPHFDSLQFINSSGDWDATGRRFVLGGITKGKAVLVILNPATGKREREIPFADIGEIYDPTWSPDGQSIAFSAIVGGVTDLYVYDLHSKKSRRLTNDAFADLQPAWSPDGKTIAFVSDRFSSRLETLAVGNYRLAAVDAVSGEVRPLPSFEVGKNIDPEWSADGRALYFVSDRNGISNVYRLDVASGERTQVTDMVTGVSGITALSPSISVGRNRLVFSAYEEDKHRIYAIDDAVRLAGGPLDDTTDRLVAASLPPVKRSSDEVLAFHADPTTGLPSAKGFEQAEYKPKLSLDYIGQPTLTVGADRTRTFIGGGISFLFSDVLGHHTLGTVLQVNGSLKDFGGMVGYENRKHRWSWGGGLEWIPYVTGSFGVSGGTIGNEPVVIEEEVLFRQTNRSASSYVAYPLSRAQRVELSGAVRNVGFSAERNQRVFSNITGELLIDTQEDLDAPEGLTYGEVGAAVAYDTSVFGATSPILGQRYRVEVTPTLGSLKFVGVLADYRRYFMPARPFTLAFRGIHYGRYGAGGEDNRLSPLFIGYSNLVRGYETGSFDPRECGVNPNACPVFDQLLGSKILVGNAELRFPPFGLFSGNRRNLYGPLPVELIFYGDTGVAWTEREDPTFINNGTRHFVSSIGTGARVNLFGYAVIEVDYVKPLDRNVGWKWAFNFAPGF
jgi:Tol biopolymer transport system component